MAAVFFFFFFVMTLVDPFGPEFLQWIAPVVMAINGLHFLRRATDSRPRLVLDSEGIRDRTSIGAVELFIPWNEVSGIQISPGRRTVELGVRDVARIRRNTGWIRRIWMLVGGLAGKRTISISPGLSGLKKQDFADLIETALLAYEGSQLEISRGHHQ